MQDGDSDESYFRSTHLGSGWFKVLMGGLPSLPLVILSLADGGAGFSEEMWTFFLPLYLVPVLLGCVQIRLVRDPRPLMGGRLKVLLAISFLELTVFPIGTLVHWRNASYGIRCRNEPRSGDAV